jgi:hypothetical protein
MKINSTVSKFLTNKWVLNIVSILALFNVIGYIVTGNFNSVIIFIIIGILVRYFSKNMTIILGVPLLLVNLLFSVGKIKEGMENSSNKKLEQSYDNSKKNENSKPKNNSGTKKTGQGLPMSKIENSSEENNAAQTSDGSDGFEVGRSKGKGHEIDYATTIEDAYDNLNNILGGEGIQRLTSDSKRLMEQQTQLAEAMKNMGPLLQSMQPMVQNLQGMMGQMGSQEGLGGLMDLAKKIIPAQSK